jgi:DNA-binding CsgD family transcriptional regulator
MLISTMQDPELIAGLYEAAAQPERWHSAWGALCHAFGAEAGMLFQQDHPTATPRILASLRWENGQPAPPCGTRANCETLHGGLADRTARSFAGRDVVCVNRGGGIITAPSHGGSYHVLCATVPLEGAARAGLGLHRSRAADAFEESDRAALDRIARHVAAALRLEKLLAEERLASAARGAALDSFARGALIVDSAGTLYFANDAAYAIAETGGIRLGENGTELTCADPAEAARLARLVHGAARGGAGGSLRITRPGNLPPLAATVAPLPLPLAIPRATSARLALVTVRDLAATPDAGPAQLMSLFGLTAAEAAILPQLLAGDSAALIAQSRGVAVATIRTQAARVLAKTGATNLRALASMIAALGCM